MPADADVTLFITLTLTEGNDDFTVEAGWSEDGTFPWDDWGSSKFSDVAAPRYCDRISHLWVAGGLDRPWEIVPRQTIADVRARLAAAKRGDRAAVKRLAMRAEVPVDVAIARAPTFAADAVDKVVQYVLPVFERVLAVWRGSGDGASSSKV